MDSQLLSKCLLDNYTFVSETYNKFLEVVSGARRSQESECYQLNDVMLRHLFCKALLWYDVATANHRVFSPDIETPFPLGTLLVTDTYKQWDISTTGESTCDGCNCARTKPVTRYGIFGVIPSLIEADTYCWEGSRIGKWCVFLCDEFGRFPSHVEVVTYSLYTGWKPMDTIIPLKYTPVHTLKGAFGIRCNSLSFHSLKGISHLAEYDDVYSYNKWVVDKVIHNAAFPVMETA